MVGDWGKEDGIMLEAAPVNVEVFDDVNHEGSRDDFDDGFWVASSTMAKIGAGVIAGCGVGFTGGEGIGTGIEVVLSVDCWTTFSVFCSVSGATATIDIAFTLLRLGARSLIASSLVSASEIERAEVDRANSEILR